MALRTIESNGSKSPRPAFLAASIRVGLECFAVAAALPALEHGNRVEERLEHALAELQVGRVDQLTDVADLLEVCERPPVAVVVGSAVDLVERTERDLDLAVMLLEEGEEEAIVRRADLVEYAERVCGCVAIEELPRDLPRVERHEGVELVAAGLELREESEGAAAVLLKERGIRPGVGGHGSLTLAQEAAERGWREVAEELCRRYFQSVREFQQRRKAGCFVAVLQAVHEI